MFVRNIEFQLDYHLSAVSWKEVITAPYNN